jgi:hypothetical protein
MVILLGSILFPFYFFLSPTFFTFKICLRSKFLPSSSVGWHPYLIRFAGAIGNTGWETIWEHYGNVNIALEQSSYQRDSFFSFFFLLGGWWGVGRVPN